MEKAISGQKFKFLPQDSDKSKLNIYHVKLRDDAVKTFENLQKQKVRVWYCFIDFLATFPANMKYSTFVTIKSRVEVSGVTWIERAPGHKNTCRAPFSTEILGFRLLVYYFSFTNGSIGVGSIEVG